jgi:hypothetical protein
MQHDPEAANLLAVALVTAMVDRFDAGDDPANGHRHAVRIADMITDARLGSDVAVDDYIAALGVLAARAVEDVARLSGEPMAFWLARWLGEPFGRAPS